MAVLAMRYPKIQKLIDRACFSIFLYGTVFAVTPILFGLDALFEFEVIKALFGLAIVLGWLAVVVATLAFIFNTTLWVIDKAPWYWKTLSPVNFSFVLLAAAFLGYNKEFGFTIPLLIIGAALTFAWLVAERNIYRKKPFLFLLVPIFLCSLSYVISLFIGSVLFFVSVYAKRGSSGD